MQGAQSTVLRIYVAMICQTQNDLWTRSLYIPCDICIVQGWLFILMQDFKEKLLVGYYQTLLFLVVPKYMFSIRFPTDVSEILAVCGKELRNARVISLERK